MEAKAWLNILYMAHEQDPDLPNGDDEIVEADFDADDDVALRPGPNADPSADIERYIKPEVRALYDVFSYRHAAAILANSFPVELEEIQQALLAFRISVRDIGMPGGNESVIPKKFSGALRPAGWVETRIQGDLLVRSHSFLPGSRQKEAKRSERKIENFIDGHKIDYVKGRVAFDMEWNSKDQTFDRDLYAMRTFHECGLISAGVMVTRSASLNHVFEKVPQLDKASNEVGKSVKAKFGASTTWMGKLLYRLNAGRHGGCPVLVFGITPKLIQDWN